MMSLRSLASAVLRVARRILVGRAAPVGVFGLLAGVAHAHDGHGLLGSHWHATDVLGFVGVGAELVAAVWWGRK